MIIQTRGNIQKGAANTIIFAGYFVAGTAILHFIFSYFKFSSFNPSYLWLLMIPMSIGCFVISNRKKKEALVKTHIGTIVSKIWFAFFISILIFLLAVIGFTLIGGSNIFTLLITPVILILLGSAQYVTAVAMRFNPFFKGAYAFCLGALLCITLSPFFQTKIQFVILAISMIAGFVIPGYILNRKIKLNKMFKDLDPLLHSQLRLAIVSLLLSVEEADFVFLREKTGATAGNLSVQIDKLNYAGYIDVRKFIDGKKPRTVCKITTLGISAFDSYVKVLQEYIKK